MDGKRGNSKRTQNNKKNSAFKSKRKRTIREHVSKGVIRRLARRGGVRRISALIYDEMRSVLKAYLGRLVTDSIIYCEYSNRTTVQVEDVLAALKRRGERLYGFNDVPLPIKIRSTIVLTDTPEQSIPSTMENIESNVADTEILKENTAKTSRRLSENLSDSDSSLPEITEIFKTTRSSRLFSKNGEIPNASANGDSKNSESLISPQEKTSSAEKINSFNASKAITKNTNASVKRASSGVTANKTIENLDSETIEENNSVLPEKTNRKTLNVSKSSSKNTVRKSGNLIPGNADKVTREPLNERRRRLFRHAQNPAAALRNSGSDKPTNSTAKPKDDFQEYFSFLVNNKKSLERSKLSAKK